MIGRAVAALLMTLAITANAVLAEDEPAVPKDAFATVGSASITRAQVKAATLRGTTAQTLQRLVQEEFLRGNLKRDGVDVADLSDADFQAGLATMKARLKKNSIDFDTMLEKTGQTLAQFEAAFRFSVAFMKAIRSRVSDEELQSLYEKNKLKLGGELRVSHLFVKIRKDRDPRATKARAAELLAKLQAIEPKNLPAAFADLASRESDDPMGALTGGDLDWITRKGGTGVSMAVVVTAFEYGKQGLLPEPCRSRDGFHVIFVTELKLPASVTYDSLRPQLEDMAVAERAQTLLAAWRKRTPIRYAKDAPGKPPNR